MCLKDKIRLVLVENYGPFNSILEHQYEDMLTEKLIGENIENKKAWITYNQVILELKYSLKDTLRVKELQYKLTENMNPNNVCIEVIEEVKDYNLELKRLYNKIKNF